MLDWPVATSPVWETAVHLAVTGGVFDGIFLCCPFPTRCLGWDLGLNWVGFWGISYLLFHALKACPLAALNSSTCSFHHQVSQRKLWGLVVPHTSSVGQTQCIGKLICILRLHKHYNIKEWTGIDFVRSTRAAENRTRWKGIVANSSEDLPRLWNRIEQRINRHCNFGCHGNFMKKLKWHFLWN